MYHFLCFNCDHKQNRLNLTKKRHGKQHNIFKENYNDSWRECVTKGKRQTGVRLYEKTPKLDHLWKYKSERMNSIYKRSNETSETSLNLTERSPKKIGPSRPKPRSRQWKINLLKPVQYVERLGQKSRCFITIILLIYSFTWGNSWGIHLCMVFHDKTKGEKDTFLRWISKVITTSWLKLHHVSSTSFL